MLLGQYEGVIDEKRRTAFPKRYRDELGENVIITKGLDTQLIMVAEKDWETLLEGTEGKPFIQKNVRELQRFLLGNAQQVTFDSKGRFIIPEYLGEYAKLSEEITYVGVGRFIEVWDKKIWRAYQDKIATGDTIINIAESLVKENNERV
jgi:MraZ protein